VPVRKIHNSDKGNGWEQNAEQQFLHILRQNAQLPKRLQPETKRIQHQRVESGVVSAGPQMSSTAVYCIVNFIRVLNLSGPSDLFDAHRRQTAKVLHDLHALQDHLGHGSHPTLTPSHISILDLHVFLIN
jgi:hypothetical protein